MGESLSTKEKFAIKQILKSNLDSTIKELEFGNFFFRNPEKNFNDYAGNNNQNNKLIEENLKIFYI